MVRIVRGVRLIRKVTTAVRSPAYRRADDVSHIGRKDLRNVMPLSALHLHDECVAPAVRQLIPCLVCQQLSLVAIHDGSHLDHLPAIPRDARAPSLSEWHSGTRESRHRPVRERSHDIRFSTGQDQVQVQQESELRRGWR